VGEGKVEQVDSENRTKGGCAKVFRRGLRRRKRECRREKAQEGETTFLGKETDDGPLGRRGVEMRAAEGKVQTKGERSDGTKD